LKSSFHKTEISFLGPEKEEKNTSQTPPRPDLGRRRNCPEPRGTGVERWVLGKKVRGQQLERQGNLRNAGGGGDLPKVKKGNLPKRGRNKLKGGHPREAP